MRILLTNDDGVHGPGLEVLEAIAGQLSDDVWVVAPETEQSGAARALTLTEPVRVRKAGEKRFAVAGRPSYCVLLCVLELLGERKPDLVLSGVNKGQNIAEDVTFSGTIAGAAMAMQMGLPAIALSQAQNFRFPGSCPFECARTFGAEMIRKVLAVQWPADVLININFPDREPGEVAGVEITRQGHRDERILYVEGRIDLRTNPYYWIGYRSKLSNPPEGTDLRAIYEGRISITPLHLDLTHEATLAAMRAACVPPDFVPPAPALVGRAGPGPE